MFSRKLQPSPDVTPRKQLCERDSADDYKRVGPETPDSQPVTVAQISVPAVPTTGVDIVTAAWRELDDEECDQASRLHGAVRLGEHQPRIDWIGQPGGIG